MRPKINSTWIVFLLFLSAVTYSQEKLPLKSIFTALEQQHHVTFNYTEEAISDFVATPPSASLPLQKQLEALQQQIPVGFEIIDGKYIIVTAVKPDIENQNHMAIDLNEVVIENFLTSGISKKKYGNFEIKPEKFGILPGLIEPDVLQTMQQIPGIYSVDESISNINVRGGTHDQNLFLWNGIRMFQTGHFFGLISVFNPVLPNTISISKNGSPAYYGESVSSVVDISTHDEKMESRFGVGANLLSMDFFAKVKASETASFVVSGRRSYTDLVNTPTYEAYYNRMFQNTIVTSIDDNQVIDYHTDEDFFFYDFTLQYRQKIGKKHEFFVDGIAISNKLGIDQTVVIDGVSNSKFSSLAQQSFGGSLHWKTIWNSKNYTRANIYVSSYNLDAVNEIIKNNRILLQQNTILDVGIRIDNHHQHTSELGFNYGYQYNETGITNFDEINLPALTRTFTEVMHSHAVIAETEYAPADRSLLVKGGLRANYFEELGELVIEPRLQFSYTLTETIKLEILGEQKSQSASQVIDLQRDFLGVEKRRWTLADDDTPLQKSTQASLGLSFQNKHWLVSVDNFYKKVAGISSTGQAFQNQLESIKVDGKYTAAGSEILIRRSFEHFYSWLGYSFNRNEYHFDYFTPNQFPSNFEIQHTISAAAVYERNRLKLALGCKWNSGRPTTTPGNFTSGSIIYNEPNNASLDDYLQFNLSASYQWIIGKSRLQANASVLNLFNNKNIINRYYRINTQARNIESVDTYALERTPNLSLRWYF